MAASVLAEYLADDPILMWALDERSGPTFRDLDPAGNHANMSAITTFMKGPVPSMSAPILLGAPTNSSANRDASVGPINTTGWPLASLPHGDLARTMEIWAYPTSLANLALLAYGYQDGGGNTHSILHIGVAGQTCFSDGVNGGNNRNWTTSFTQNKWQHFVMTYAGGTNGAFIFYRDAVADTTSTVTLNTTVFANRVRAGLRSDDATATLYFAGGLSLAAIYPTALSPARIQAHYDAVRQAAFVS